MWLKFDGKKFYIKLENRKKFLECKDFVIGKWIHIVDINGKLYIDGKEIEETIE
jgi:hypothetical protein